MTTGARLVDRHPGGDESVPKAERAMLFRRDADVLFCEFSKRVFPTSSSSRSARQGVVERSDVMEVLCDLVRGIVTGFRPRLVTIGGGYLVGAPMPTRGQVVAVVVGLGATRTVIVERGGAKREHLLGHGALVVLPELDSLAWHVLPRQPSSDAFALTLWG